MQRFLVRNSRLLRNRPLGIARKGLLGSTPLLSMASHFPFCSANSTLPPSDDPLPPAHPLIYKRERLTKVPLSDQTLPLTAEESKQESKTYVMVNEVEHMVPFEKHKLLQIAKVGQEMVDHPLVFFPRKDEEGIYTVGLVLSKRVTQALKRVKAYQDSQAEDQIKKHDMLVEYSKSLAVVVMASKQRNYRVRLTSLSAIEGTNRYLVQAIPYKDKPKSLLLQKHSLDNEISKIKGLITNIKLQNEYEKIEAFADINV